jgi:hypothetical protein
METKKTKATGSETSATIDLSEELKGTPKKQRQEILDAIGEILIERTLEALASQKSPVEGYGRFKALDQEYRKKKKEETGSGDANLDYSGSMISSLDFNVSGNEITIGVFGDDAPKADGHNNLSGASTLPLRRFLPAEGETYTRDIRKLIQEEIAFTKADKSASGLEALIGDVETKTELYALLEATLGEQSRGRLRELALGSAIRDILYDNDLLDLL